MGTTILSDYNSVQDAVRAIEWQRAGGFEEPMYVCTGTTERGVFCKVNPVRISNKNVLQPTRGAFTPEAFEQILDEAWKR